MANPHVFVLWGDSDIKGRTGPTYQWHHDFTEKEFLYCEDLVGYDGVSRSGVCQTDCEFADAGMFV